MLRFFRNIRRRLLDSGSLRKYFVYAVGEILLVVIGILIALQMNNWNERRKDINAENLALIDLKHEFEQNQKRLDFLIDIKQNIEQHCRSYLDTITNAAIPLEDKIRATKPDNYDGTWSVENSTLNSLLNTGGINRIRNDSLKLLLTTWGDKVNDYKVTEVLFLQSIHDWEAYSNTKVPRPIVLPGDHSDVWPGAYFPNNMSEKADSMMVSLIDDVQYYNYIAVIAARSYINLITAKLLTDDYHKISKLIDQEIKDRKINIKN